MFPNVMYLELTAEDLVHVELVFRSSITMKASRMMRDVLSRLGGATQAHWISFKRWISRFPSVSQTLQAFILHGTLSSTIVVILVALIVVLKQWYDKPIAVGPFTVVSGADAYGITAEALTDQLKGQISRINAESGELFESRKLVDNAVPLDIKLGNTGWTFATLTRAFGLRFTSAEITGRVSKTGDFLVMQFTTSFGDRIREEKMEISLPKAPVAGSIKEHPIQTPDQNFLAQIEAGVNCMALKVVAGVSRDIAANYLHKQDEAAGYDPGVGSKGKTNTCIQDDDVSLYSQVREDRFAAPFMRVNALIGLSVHYQQTQQHYEALIQAQGARALARATMPCEDDLRDLSFGQRVRCIFHHSNAKNRVAQIASWMQLGAAFSDYANVAATIGERHKRRSSSIAAYAHVRSIDRNYAPGADALGLQWSFAGNTELAEQEFKQSLKARETAAVHMDYGVAMIQGRSSTYTNRAIAFDVLDKAADHFAAAINLEPGYWDAHSQLGYTLYLHGQYSESADVLQVAVDNDLSNRHLRRLLASVLGNLCHFDDAHKIFQKAYKAGISADEAALAAGRDASQVDSSTTRQALDVLSDWGRALYGFGFHEAALQQETDVLRQDSQHLSARVFRGMMRISSAANDQKEVDGALSDFEAAVKIDSTHSEFVLESYMLGLLKARRFKQAVDLYREWSTTGLVTMPVTQGTFDPDDLSPNQRLRLLYADALQQNNMIMESQRELKLLSSVGSQTVLDAAALRPLAGATVGDEDNDDKQGNYHACRMGNWSGPPQLSDVAI